MIPKPPGSDSACRAGNGFQISNTRKSINPTSKYFQFEERKKEKFASECIMRARSGWVEWAKRCPPSKRAICWPETSSITTFCGSFMPQKRAASLEVQRPTKATNTMLLSTNTLGSTYTRVSPTSAEWEIDLMRAASQKGNVAAAIPASEPKVPGALGR